MPPTIQARDEKQADGERKREGTRARIVVSTSKAHVIQVLLHYDVPSYRKL